MEIKEIEVNGNHYMVQTTTNLTIPVYKDTLKIFRYKRNDLNVTILDKEYFINKYEDYCFNKDDKEILKDVVQLFQEGKIDSVTLKLDKIPVRE